MSRMNEACKKVLDSVADAIACGVLDLEHRNTLEVAHIPQFSNEQQEVTSQAIMNLFQGTNARQLAHQVHAQLGKQDTEEKDFNEIQMAFQKHFYFSKAVKSGKAAVLLITKETTNIGMAWVQLKSIIPVVEPLIP